MPQGWHGSCVYAGVCILMLLRCLIQSAMASPYAEGVFLDAEGVFLYARAVCSELRFQF